MLNQKDAVDLLLVRKFESVCFTYEFMKKHISVIQRDNSIALNFSKWLKTLPQEYVINVKQVIRYKWLELSTKLVASKDIKSLFIRYLQSEFCNLSNVELTTEIDTTLEMAILNSNNDTHAVDQSHTD